MIIHVCDNKCGMQGTPTSGSCPPKGWKTITFHVSYSRGNKTYILCPDCQTKLGIPQNDATPYTIGDKLLDIIAEIAADAVADTEANR